MLVEIEVPSIYQNGPLPRGLARSAPDTKVAILSLVQAVQVRGQRLRLSDLFRSRELQMRSHLDWITGRKRAFSPAPGGSMHEAGRAMDIDLGAIGMPLVAFWKLAAEQGFVPVIETPDSGLPEAWHFDHRGSHHKVYDYVKAGKAGPRQSPYRQMAMSAILDAGIAVDGLEDQGVGLLQSSLIRLGGDPGPIDGLMGTRTRIALAAFGTDEVSARNSVEAHVRIKWPQEFAVL